MSSPVSKNPKPDLSELYPRRTNRKNKTRQQIKRTARKLFRVQGYKNTTMANIADATDVHVTTVFNHFDSKMDLLYECTDDLFAEHVEEIEERHREEKFLDFYPEMLLGRVSRQEARGDRVVDSNWVTDDPEIFPAYIKYEISRAKLYARCIAEDLGLDADSDPRPQLIANLLVSSNLNNYIRWRASNSSLDFSKETRKTLAGIQQLIGDYLNNHFPEKD